MPTDSRLFGHRDRLREKLLAGGRHALADYELLELILASAIPRKDVKLLAKDLIAKFDSLAGVIRADSASLEQITGMTRHAAAAIKTIEAAMVRTLEIELESKAVLTDMSHIEKYLKGLLGGKTNEELHVFYLDAKTKLIKTELASSGTINSSLLYPREIAKRALELGAIGVMIAHNHPSGDTKPSAKDIEMTKQLAAGLRLMDIILFDHLIVGGGSVYSFKAHGHDF